MTAAAPGQADDMRADPPFACTAAVEFDGGKFACCGTPGHAGKHSYLIMWNGQGALAAQGARPALRRLASRQWLSRSGDPLKEIEERVAYAREQLAQAAVDVFLAGDSVSAESIREALAAQGARPAPGSAGVLSVSRGDGTPGGGLMAYVRTEPADGQSRDLAAEFILRRQLIADVTSHLEEEFVPALTAAIAVRIEAATAPAGPQPAPGELGRMAQENIRLAAENRMLRESAAAALKLALEADGTDGAHHKQWLLDQVTRALTGGQQHLEDQGITP